MRIDVSFNASNREDRRTFQHTVGTTILDTEDPFDEGWNKANEWCERNDCFLVSVNFVNKFDDAGRVFLGSVTSPGQKTTC